jgi:hypothetical protein
VARINVDDDVESRPEYRKLLKLMGGDDDRALGMLVRFWRHAQRLWAHGKLVSSEDMEEWGWQALVESRWAIEREGGFYAIGSEERFAWYVQKVEAGKLGGRRKEPIGSFREPERTGANRTVPPATPLAPALAPAPALVLKKEREEKISIDGIERAVEVWGETLRKHGRSRDPKTDQAEIGRLIILYGLEKTLLALFGAGFEEGSPTYKPSKHIGIRRLFDAKNFDTFVNLGDHERTTQALRKERDAELQAQREAAATPPPMAEEFAHMDPSLAKELALRFMRGVS